MSGIIRASAPRLLYSLSMDSEGKPTIREGEHSTFHTSAGGSIQDIQKLPYAVNATGRFSRVQTIQDTNGNKYVVKHLKRHYSPDNVLREVQNLAAFHGNPAVAQILGAELYSSEAFIIFQYVPGKTLFDWIRTDPPPSREEHIRRYDELSTAIQTIHDNGYAHLDIHPSNIWIPDDPRTPLFLLDLGSMHKIDEERTMVTGTPGYFPPLENISKATRHLNMYALEKVKTLHPPAPAAPPAPALDAPVGGAGAGHTGGSRRRRHRTSKRRKHVSKTRKH